MNFSMLKIKGVSAKISIFVALAFVATACTGKIKLPSDQGGILIQGAQVINVDMSDVFMMNIGTDYKVTLKTVSADYQTARTLVDLTEQIQEGPGANGVYKIVLDKGTQAVKPLLLVVDIPAINYQITDVILGSANFLKPNIASQLAYTLIKYYPARLITDYTQTDFDGIKTLISTRMNQMLAQSEFLSMTGTRFDRLIRYFTNGLAFNMAFMDAVRSYGVNYGYSPVLAPGVVQANLPPNTVIGDFSIAGNFTIAGAPVLLAPFNHSNSSPRLMPSVSIPTPAANILANEGNTVHVLTQSFDPDDDFMDKSFIVQYIPRILPVTAVPPFAIPEPTPEYRVMANLSLPDAVDEYTSATIKYNEALDTLSYPAPADTAYRNVYYLISDGTMMIPYRWNFRYNDANRPPQIVTTADGKINDSQYDLAIDPTTSRFSMCEPTAAQVIHSRVDGPWYCAFKVFDPDLDDDPNGAPDTFNFRVNQIDPFTQVNFRQLDGTRSSVWPPLPPYTTAAPNIIVGQTVTTCVDVNGKTHQHCGEGIYQVVIDNAVKTAAEGKADLQFTYGVQINDRPLGAGLSTSKLLTRKVEFTPVPPRLVNFAAPAKPAGVDSITTLVGDGTRYTRTDTYLDEFLASADPTGTLDLTAVGMSANSSSVEPAKNSLAGNANRSVFLSGTTLHLTTPGGPVDIADPISSYITQPRKITNVLYLKNGTLYNTPQADAITVPTGVATLEGNNLNATPTPFTADPNEDAKFYNTPREYDSVCKKFVNNIGSYVLDGDGFQIRGAPSAGNWDQSSSLGWTFEIDAVDYDNVGLHPGEPTDPVYLSFTHDIDTSLNADNAITYCWPTDPNRDAAVFEVYSAVGNLAAIDPEACTWKTSPPTKMQPMPIFYTAHDTATNTDVAFKSVYHRLRVKWQPKDQSTNLGVRSLPYYIVNSIKKLVIHGNRNELNSSELRDISEVSDLKLAAIRKDMEPCLSVAAMDFIHQNYIDSIPTIIKVDDANKTIPLKDSGFSAELTLKGGRGINDPEFLKLVPFYKIDSAPAIWYTTVSAPISPKIRLFSNDLNFSTSFHFNPIQKAGSPYSEAVLITNLDTSAAHDVALGNCFSQDKITLYPEEQTVLMARIHGGGCSTQAENAVLWSDSKSTGVVKFVLDGTKYGYPTSPITSLKQFPSLYQAETHMTFNQAWLGFPFTSLTAGQLANIYDRPNMLFFDVQAFDNFQLKDGFPVDANLTGTNKGFLPTSTYGSVRSTNSLIYEYLDWDNQPLNLTLAQPTPDPTLTYVRQAVGDATKIEVYSKDPAYAEISVPVHSSDVTPGNVDFDAFDVFGFELKAPATPLVPAPAHDPTLAGINRTTCTEFPTNYPNTLSTLNYTTLTPFRSCKFKWKPEVADAGNKYIFNIEVQDNQTNVGGAHPWGPTSPAIFDPLGFGHSIPSDTATSNNGPTKIFTIQTEVLEPNAGPDFTGASGSLYTSTSVPGGSAWRNVFSGGVQPNPAACTTQSGFNCALQISAGDALQSATATAMDENGPVTFSVTAENANHTAAFRKLTGKKPLRVLIAGGTHAGRSYDVPSFSKMTMIPGTPTNQNDLSQPSATSFTFQWTPTDEEAFFLSNPEGFLIPVEVTNDQYDPSGGATGFPTDFITPAKKTTIWIWCKLNVVNNAPSVYAVSTDGVETGLSGATLTFQTQVKTTYKLRIKDADYARVKFAAETSGFSLVASPVTNGNVSIVAPTPAPLNQVAATANANAYVYQEYELSGIPTTVASYPVNLTITDPGDPTLGLAKVGAGTPVRAQLAAGAGGNDITIPFTISVVGRPDFTLPSAGIVASAYTNKPFAYPLALSVSRPSDQGNKTFFMGLKQDDTLTPMKKALGDGGLYVNEKYVLRWTSANVPANSGNHSVTLYAINSTSCNDALNTPAITLIRYNESGSTMETCKLSSASQTNDLASQTMTVNLVQATPPAVLTYSAASLVRTYTNASPVDVHADVQGQYAEFKSRCTVCSSIYSQTGAAPLGAILNDSNSSGSVEFRTNNYATNFTFDTSAGTNVTKTYNDALPSATRNILSSVSEGEKITLSANVTPAPGAAPYQYYRWYVNGCLKFGGNITGGTITHDFDITSSQSGTNNDCSGEYKITETGSGTLGAVLIRLSLSNGSETFTSTSDASPTTYLWKVTVVNTNPVVQIASGQAFGSGDSTYSGNMSSTMATSVLFDNKEFIAYSDTSTTPGNTGLKIRLREIVSGAISTTSSNNITVNCANTFASLPTWMGVQAQSDGKLYIAASSTTGYPQAYGDASKNCFAPGISPGAGTVDYTPQANSSTDAAGYLAFSQFSASTLPNVYYSNSASLYRSGTGDANYFLMSKALGARTFWTSPLSSIYTATPTELTTYNNSIRKSLVISGTTGSALVQFVGAQSTGTANWRGYILIGKIATADDYVQINTSTMTKIMFSKTSAGANDCSFDGTPLTGAYVPATDTLYALVNSNDTGNGKFVAIRKATTASAKCVEVDSTLINPSLDENAFNPNLAKIVYDSTRGMIYGLINGAKGDSQVFSFDAYAEKMTPNSLSSNISGSQLILTPKTNSIFLYDAGGTTAHPYPNLYSIW